MTTNLSKNRWAATDAGNRPADSAAKSDRAEPADPLATPTAGARPAVRGADDGHAEPEKLGLNKALEEACLNTGATGAAIALAWGAEMICLATTGPGAPDLGTRLDPGRGLTGSCIQTRQLQQCSDTETDPRVDIEACRFLGVRSIAVLPIVDSGELFGIFEVFSSRPNAFGEYDLSTLRSLAAQILALKRLGYTAIATPAPKNPSLDAGHPALLTREFSLTTEQRKSRPRRRDYRTGSVTAAVVALAMLLGWMIGRAGWNAAINHGQSEIQTAPEDISSSPAARTQVSPEITNSNLSKPVGQVEPEEAQGSTVMNVWVGTNAADPTYAQDPVVLSVLVGTDGSVRDVKMIGGDPQLLGAVVDAVRRWHFKPRSLNGHFVDFETRITVKFAPEP